MVDCRCAFCTGDYSSTEKHFGDPLSSPEDYDEKGTPFPVIFFAVLAILALLELGGTFA